MWRKGLDNLRAAVEEGVKEFSQGVVGEVREGVKEVMHSCKLVSKPCS